MKSLLLRAISTRRKLNEANKSNYRSEQFIKNLEYWIANGADIDKIVQKHENLIRLMLPPSFMNKFEKLLVK